MNTVFLQYKASSTISSPVMKLSEFVPLLHDLASYSTQQQQSVFAEACAFDEAKTPSHLMENRVAFAAAGL